MEQEDNGRVQENEEVMKEVPPSVSPPIRGGWSDGPIEDQPRNVTVLLLIRTLVSLIVITSSIILLTSPH